MWKLYKIELEQTNFERNIKKSLGFEHFSVAKCKYATLKKIELHVCASVGSTNNINKLSSDATT